VGQLSVRFERNQSLRSRTCRHTSCRPRAAIGVFKRWVNIRKSLASGIQEKLANGLSDGFVGPVWYDLNP